jgi:hypothetical protein
MGLCNAPDTFMQLMNDIFGNLLNKTVLMFLNGILVMSYTLQEQLQAGHVRHILERLRNAKLCAKLSECQFFRREVKFLGHHIGAADLSVKQDKISAVRKWPVPRDVSAVCLFLNFAGFYRRFVKEFSEIALPITELTKTVIGAPFAWGTRQESVFTRLKGALCEAPALLIADLSLKYTANCDERDYAFDVTLQQNLGNGLQPVAYYSHKLTPAEKNYDMREKQFLVLVEACRHWRLYLHSGRPIKLLTDHHLLKYYMTMLNLAGQIARLIERMAEFNYSIEHISGVKNVTANALSRRADYKEQHLSVLRLRPRVITPAVNPALHRIANRAAAKLVVPPLDGAPRASDAHGVIRVPSQVCAAETRSGAPWQACIAMRQNY